jgi:predicted NACHT family NTPase
VLGEPGAGKTILMMRLVLDLLAQRVRGSPVPVLVSAASWDPTTQDLHGWLAGQLIITYTALAVPAQLDAAAPSRIRALLGEGLILPIVDGLDEIPDAMRGPAIARINDAMRAGERLVVTCRSAPYRDAIQPAGGPHITLRGDTGVKLCTLDADAIERNLIADART